MNIKRMILVAVSMIATMSATAQSFEVKDFEDMLQYQCAKAAGCDVIITNNKRDFYAFSDLPFLTSMEFLLQFDFQ